MKVRGGSSTEIYSTPKDGDLYPSFFHPFFLIVVLYGAMKIEYQDICQECSSDWIYRKAFQISFDSCSQKTIG